MITACGLKRSRSRGKTKKTVIHLTWSPPSLVFSSSSSSSLKDSLQRAQENVATDLETQNPDPQEVFSSRLLYCYFRHCHAPNWSFHHIPCLLLSPYLCLYTSNETHDGRGHTQTACRLPAMLQHM